METNIVLEITVSKNFQRRITQYAAMDWVEMLRHIYSVSQRVGWTPAKLLFSQSLGPLDDLIACNKKMAGLGFGPRAGVVHRMVVKVSVSKQPQSYVVWLAHTIQPSSRSCDAKLTTLVEYLLRKRITPGYEATAQPQHWRATTQHC